MEYFDNIEYPQYEDNYMNNMAIDDFNFDMSPMQDFYQTNTMDSQDVNSYNEPISMEDPISESTSMDITSRPNQVIDHFLSSVDNEEIAKSLLASEYPHLNQSLGFNSPDVQTYIKPDPLSMEFANSSDSASSFNHKRSRQGDAVSESVSFETKAKRKYAPRKTRVKLTEDEEQDFKAHKNREAARKFRKKQQTELQTLLDKEQELIKLNELYAKKEKEILVQNEIKRKEAEQLYQNIQHLITFAFSQMSTGLLEQVKSKAQTLGIQENM